MKVGSFTKTQEPNRNALTGRTNSFLEAGLELRSFRLFGSCWLAFELWRQLGLHEFWYSRLAGSREDIPWEKVLQLLV